MGEINTLDALGPLDGRYAEDMESMRAIFGERGLIENRCLVEGEYLIFLSEHPEIGVREFTDAEKRIVRAIYDPGLPREDAEIVKAIETKGYAGRPKTKHDVKAVEYFIKDRLRETSLEDSLEWVHFGLTSEDVTNLAYAVMLGSATKEVIIPAAVTVRGALGKFAGRYAATSMLARTHGQPASPTTFGKECRVFASRLEDQLEQLAGYELRVKLNGASGNYNAHHAAYPNVDWLKFTEDFVGRLMERTTLKFRPNLITTQIEPHDTYAEFFAIVKRMNTILIGFDQGMWQYISDEWVTQKPVAGEVGSSTMPNKINPIDLENSEGNLGIANAIFEFFERKLPISRLQRDLSDSTVERNFGVALGYSLLGYKSALKNLGKISLNQRKVAEALESHPEVLSEPIQTILRREGVATPYEKLKDLTRGKEVTLEDIRAFISGLDDISDEVREELLQLTPEGYTGIAERIATLD